MSERPLNALRFMSIVVVVVDGATYTFQNTLLQKKGQSNKTLSKLQWNTCQRGYEMKYVLLFMRFCYIMIVNL